MGDGVEQSSIEGSPRAVFVARDGAEVWRRYWSRIEMMRREGLEVDVLAPRGEGLRELAARGVRTRSIPVGKAHNAAGLLGAYFMVQAHLIETQPLMVHAFGHRVAWMTAFAARQIGGPATFVSLDYHWLEEDPLKMPLGPLGSLGVPEWVVSAEEGLNQVAGMPFRQWMKRSYRWLADQVDRYVVSTEFDFQLVQDLEIVSDGRLEITPGGAGVDLGEYKLPEQGDPEREQARSELGLPAKWRQVVGVVGPLTRRHGADDLLETIEELSRSEPGLGWLVVSRGEVALGQRRRLQPWIDRDVVRLVDGEAPSALIYRAMSVLGWFGRTLTPHDCILEAAALCVPTVGYDTPGARAVVKNGTTGQLVYEGDKASLVATLARMLRDPSELEDMGWRARSLAGNQFGRRDVDDQMVRMYDRVLDAKVAEIGDDSDG